ncbi:UbiX family flavin prenyltransferase [uncultured Martelella sp.]|uniref:UbiX family flavin prenyltransferase n=1 Tax=uncultured Martelella sp. TaxID=392331 RepID=UPI0029C7482B|nr:UbiX family flavin prenyltransferase [uncultured Martelella sp.]
MPKPRIIVGISGASGAVYGITVLDMLRQAGIETHLVVSKSGELTLSEETGLKLKDLEHRADHIHPVKNVGASIASGSFKTMGMIIAPCSVRTASEISSGITSSLLTRAADVVLKERRRLVLMVRETPLHLGHLRTLTQLAEMGAVVAPPMPAFYAAPDSIDSMVRHSLGRVLDLFDIETDIVRWTGLSSS